MVHPISQICLRYEDINVTVENLALTKSPVKDKIAL